MDSMEQNKKYKDNLKELKKLKKMELNKTSEAIKIANKRREYWCKIYTHRHDKLIADIDNKKKLDITRRKKQNEVKREKKIRNQKRKIKGNKLVKYKKKDKTLSWYKKHGIADYQWCIRRDAQDNNGYVKTIDLKIREWKNCDAGHYFSKSLYPHMIFYPGNCHPQSKRDNKQQGQTTGYEHKEEIIKRIGLEEYNKMCEFSNNELEKNKIRKKEYRKEKYNYWHKKRILRYNKQ